MLQQQLWQVLSRLTLEPSMPVSLSLLRLKIILGKWISKLIKKASLALRNVIYSLQDDLIGKLRGKVIL